MWKRAKRGIWKDLGEGKRREKCNIISKFLNIKKTLEKIKAAPSHTHDNVPPWFILLYCL